MISFPDKALDTLDVMHGQFKTAVTSFDFYIQLGMLGISLLAALVVASVTRQYARTHPLDAAHHTRLSQIVTHAVLTLAAPLVALLTFGLSLQIALHYWDNAGMLQAAITLSLAWFIGRLASLFISNRIMARFITAMVFVAAILHITELWLPALEFMDSLAVTIGTFRISLLMVSRGILLFAILIWVAGTISRLADRYLRQSAALNYNTRELIKKFFNITLYILVLLTTLNYMGVDLTALAVFGGAVGVGVGLGLQKIASNFISGIILLFERSVKAGDLVEVGGVVGWVRELAVRHTLLETPDGREIIIPNEDLITSRVTNWTYSNNRARIEITVGVAYTSDPQQVRNLLLEAAREHPRCLVEPETTAFLSNFGDSAITFQLNFWVADVTQGRFGTKSEVMMAILNKFRAAGIEVPFPQRELHIKSVPDSLLS